ncbi:MAG: PspA/IM30 family protein [Spirochaetales bacterium]
MEDDFDLEGLSVADARAYVVEFIQSQKQTQTQLEVAERDLEAWKKRTKIATDQGEVELAKAALARAEDAHAKVSTLKRELRELDFKVTELKRRLSELQKKPQLSTNADALLEQLESVVGTDYETDRGVAEAEAELALQKLRAKMEEEEQSRE